MTDPSPPRTPRFWALWGFAFATWGTALFLASPYDLELSQSLADPKGAFGRFIWLWGTTPSGVLYLAALAVLMVPRLRRNTSGLVQVAAVTLLVMALLHPLFITTSIKLLWGRQRFVELAGDWSRFTLFYIPVKPLAGESFPSGHVATAFVCFPLVILLAREGRKAGAAALLFVTIAWGVTVSYGRILNGAHYLTDTIFSAGLSFLLAPFVVDLGRWTWNRWYRRLAETVTYEKWVKKEAKGVVALAPPGTAAAKELEWLAWTYAAGQAKILDALGIDAGKQPITCFFYPSNQAIYKYTRRNFGFHIGDAQEVHSYFASRSDRQSTGHEMTHSITHRAWGEPVEALMGEGIAVAMDLSGADRHARARKAIADREPGFKLAAMLGQSWWQHDMEVSYAVSGSFVTFLLEAGGVKKVKKLYQAKDLTAELKNQYGWSQAETEQKWRQTAGIAE